MKKIWLLTTLLVAGLLLTGCNNTQNNAKPSLDTKDGRLSACIEEAGRYFNIGTFNGNWGDEGEGWASFVIDWDITYEKNWETIEKSLECVIDMVDKSVTIQEVSYDIDEYPWELKDLYHAWHLVWFNHELTDISAELMFTDKIIWAKFCNDMGSDDYSIEWNTIHVRNMVQNLMLCDSEELMEYERKFDLSDAKINLVEHNLRITTSNWDVYDFYRNGYESEDEYNQFLEDIRSNIPLCNDIDINWDAEIIEIDDVVENCTYEEWTAYSWNDWWCWWVMPHLYITKDTIWYFDIVADEDHPIICKSPRAWIIKSLSGDFEDLATFWYKHWITKKALIDTLEARTDEEVFRNWCWYYFCNGDICEQFYRPSYWENEHHYYIYWYRYPLNGPYETVLLVDDKLYMLGQSENMFDEDSRPNPVKQWRWVVYWLDWDKLIVKRYVDWELIPPYTLENFNSYNFDEHTTTTKFKVKTCEIPL